MSSPKKNLGSIQLLRGIASILVVLLHITINYRENTGNIFLYNIFRFGGSGVDIFFVLSGFIITYSNLRYLGQPSTVLKFLKRRFIRIFPIYWIVITCFLILQLVFPAFYKTPFDTGWVNTVHTFLLLPEHIMLNGVSWSLTNELFFYLLFTLALLIPNKKISFYVMGTYFLFLVLFALVNPLGINGNPYIELLFFPMNIEFLLGVFIVLIVNRISKNWIYPILLAGIILFITGALLNNSDLIVVGGSSNQALNRVLLFGIPSFLIILAVVKLELSKIVNMHNIFLHLGDASYSIYLIHLPIVAAFFKIVAKFGIDNEVVLLLSSVVLFIGVCAAGIFIYHKIEKPLIEKLNKYLL